MFTLIQFAAERKGNKEQMCQIGNNKEKAADNTDWKL